MGFIKNIFAKLFVSSVLPGPGDWKTKLGSILAGIGGILKALPNLFPSQEMIAELLISIGVALGGVGIADKVNKLIATTKT